MAKLIIIVDVDENYAQGTSLEEAFETYQDYYGTNYTVDDLAFYEAEAIEVKFKIEKVEKVTLTKTSTTRK